MKKRTYRRPPIAVLVTCFVIFATVALILASKTAKISVFAPEGPIANQERSLMITGVLLSIIVVVPVFILLFGFAWKYRESNHKSTYKPEWDHNRVAETIWWLIPSALIFVIALITWHSSHTLDPFRPINSTTKPLTIQVVALDWKWLFIYPEQGVASINYMPVPVDTPLNLEITSDAPMNAFWIPQLGGQIYAMPGMSSQLHLLASRTGEYRGASANISGKGFAGMHFIAKASTQSEFASWANDVRGSSAALNQTSYNAIAKPSENVPKSTYTLTDQSLYNAIILKYMIPNAQTDGATE